MSLHHLDNLFVTWKTSEEEPASQLVVDDGNESGLVIQLLNLALG